MPTDDVGRVIVVDFGRESVSQPVPRDDLGTADDRRPYEWQSLGHVLKRVAARLSPTCSVPPPPPNGDALSTRNLRANRE